MKTNYFLLILLLISSNIIFAQKIIKMERINDTFHIPCKVNGVPMKFVFDTGASDVSISQTEANFLIKQGLLTKSDFIEKKQYQIANGELVDGMTINLKTIEIDGIIIENVRASIIDSQTAPLLLGQSAIQKFGSYTVKGNELTFLDYSPNEEVETIEIINSNKSISKDAITFFNVFLKNKNWAGETEGKLTYDKYSNTLNFDKTSVSKSFSTGEISQEITTNFAIPIDKISKIVEIVNIKDPNDFNDINFLLFDIYFKEDVRYYYLIKKKGELPTQKTDYREKVGLSPEKKLNEDDIINLRRAVRDIFVGVKFEQKGIK